MSTRSKTHNVSSPAVAPFSSANIMQLIQTQMNQQKEAFADLLNNMENRIMERISEVQAEISNLKKSFSMLTTKQTTLSKRCDVLANEVESLKLMVDKNMMDSVASDVLILSIPNNVDATEAFDRITTKLNCKNVIPMKVFKTKKDSSASSIPVIAKLKSANDRSTLFRALAAFRKSNKRTLSLSDLNCGSNENVSIFECLSALNKEILQSALTYKRNKLLSAVFTLRGAVNVKQSPEGKAVKVQTLTLLNEVVGGLS